ncbi:MAG: hypothetical protein IKQ61_06805 [Spirochaetales bacterium]|jgi:hypothetical protein|nr:hypothetical protein [Spirochaetales bacterium]
MKKIIGLFTAVMALAMILSSCSAAGAPAGLVGKWAVEGASSGNYMEITSDDRICTFVAGVKVSEASITKCTCNELTVEDADPVTYELSCDTLTITAKSGSTTVTTTYKRQ